MAMFDPKTNPELINAPNFKDCRNCMDMGTLWRLSHRGQKVWMQPRPCPCQVGKIRWGVYPKDSQVKEFPEDMQPWDYSDSNVLNVHGMWIAEMQAKGVEIDADHLQHCQQVLGMDLEQIGYISDSLAEVLPQDRKTAAAGGNDDE